MAKTTKAMRTNDHDEPLTTAARMLIDTLGEETAAAIAGKCVVTYGTHPADHEAARLANAIVEAMGVERYNAIQVF
jgi:hypothetical protein